MLYVRTPVAYSKTGNKKHQGLHKLLIFDPGTMTDTSCELSGLALRKLMLEFPKCWAGLDCIGDDRAGSRVALRVLLII